MKTLNPFYPSSSSELMLQRLRWNYSRPDLRDICTKDIVLVLRALGLGESVVKDFSEQFAEDVLKTQTLDELEEKWNQVFRPGNLMISENLKRRAKIITAQVNPWTSSAPRADKNGWRKVADFGCGDGDVSQSLVGGYTETVDGFDVRKYLLPTSKNVNFKLFNGYNTGVADNHYDVVLATNVFHHEHTNERAEDEVRRILRPGGRFVLIETVPVGSTPEKIELDFERTFVGDYFYNRILHPGVDVPVPGTYDTPEGWKSRIGRWAKLINERHLGVDIPIIQDYHWLGVFQKN